MALRMQGKVVVRVTTFNGQAPWRKHGTWRHERDEVRATLDKVASAKVAYGAAVRVRKAGGK